jgi:hypothetical protein
MVATISNSLHTANLRISVQPSLLSNPIGFDGPIAWDAVVRDLSRPAGREKLNGSVKRLLTTDNEGQFLSVRPA